ncbi:MAG: NAD-dependent epimerase/dehydratase family protein [Terriglobales bacterium]
MSARKVLLMGGTGFILSYVAERYAAMGDDVTIFDNNEQHQMPKYTVELLDKHKNVRFVQGDIRNRDLVFDVMKGVDLVYQYAALMGTSARYKQEARTVEVNILGMIHALDAALENKVKYFIYPPRPMLAQWLTPYIISKTCATQFVQLYHQYYGLPTVGLLIANCYGPRERAVLEAHSFKPGEGRKMMATFIEAALKNEPLPVMGDGEQSSDFVFVDDVVEACMLAPRQEGVGKIFEIGTGINTSVKAVAETIIELTGSKSKIEFRPLRTGEVKIHTKSDWAEAKKCLGWEPKTKLREGLIKTIPWYAEQLGLPCSIRAVTAA